VLRNIGMPENRPQSATLIAGLLDWDRALVFWCNRRLLVHGWGFLHGLILMNGGMSLEV
jgi:hypothetical protein